MNTQEIILFYLELEKHLLAIGAKTSADGYFDYRLNVKDNTDVIRFFNAMIAIRDYQQLITGIKPKEFNTKDLYRPLFIGKIRIFLIVPDDNLDGGKDTLEINNVKYKLQSKDSVAHSNN